MKFQMFGKSCTDIYIYNMYIIYKIYCTRKVFNFALTSTDQKLKTIKLYFFLNSRNKVVQIICDYCVIDVHNWLCSDFTVFFFLINGFK